MTLQACREGHIFCLDCLRMEAKQQIFGRCATTMRCLAGNCAVGFEPRVERVILSPDMRRRLDERSGAAAVAAAGMEGFESCRYCPWGAVIPVPASVDKVFRCGECEAEFCRVCGRDWEVCLGTQSGTGDPAVVDRQIRLQCCMNRLWAPQSLRFRCH